MANPASGRHQRTIGRYPPPDGVPIQSAQTFEGIGHALETLSKDDVTLLVIAGGDGTVRNVLTHILIGKLFKTHPIIAIIPSGSTNMTGHDTGMINIARKGWTPLLSFAEQPNNSCVQRTRRSVLKVRPNPDTEAFCGMIVGVGAIDHAVSYTQSHLHGVGLRGNIGPAIAFTRFLKALAVKDYRHFKPVQILVHDNLGHTVDVNALVFVATTLERLLLRFRPFWGTDVGAMAWSVVACNARGLLRRLPGAAWGRPSRKTTEANGFTSARADSVTLEFDGGFIVDGERYIAERERGPVELSIAGTLDFVSL